MVNVIRDAIGLKDRIEMCGWTAFIVSGSEINGSERPNVVAMNDGRVVFFKIIELGGTSKKTDVREESDMLSSLVTDTGGMSDKFNAYFAISNKRKEGWHIKSYSRSYIGWNEDYRQIEEVLYAV